MRAALHCGAANAGDMDRFRSPPWYKYNVKLDFLAITKAGSRLVWIVLDDPKLVNEHILFRILSGYKPITVLNIVPFYDADDVEVRVHRMVRHKRWHHESSPRGGFAADSICYYVHVPRLGANVTGRIF